MATGYFDHTSGGGADGVEEEGMEEEEMEEMEEEKKDKEEEEEEKSVDYWSPGDIQSLRDFR